MERYLDQWKVLSKEHMMERAITAAVGVVSAGTVALVQIAAASTVPVVVGWSLVGGAAGAGVAWGALNGKVKEAHARIVAEEENRRRAVGELKDDMVRGFSEIKTDLREQTRTVLEAIDRGPR